jgi:kumamolisin
MKSMSIHSLAAGMTIVALAACAAPQGTNALVPPAQPNASSASRPTSTSNASGVIATVPSGPGVTYRDFGQAPAKTQLHINLTLNYTNGAGLAQFIEQQRASSAPHWLTNDEFNARFAPTAQAYALVRRSLGAAGLRVEAVYSNRTVIDAVGPVGAIERYFGTEIHQVEQSGYGRRFVNVRPAYASAELRDVVSSVDGLSNLVLVRTTHSRVTPQAASAALRAAPDANKSTRLFGPVSSATNVNGYAPLAFQKAYDFPSVHASGGKVYDGKGRAAGIIIDADFADGDIATYLSYFGIVRTGPAPKRVLVDFGPPGSYSGDSVEATLDVETIAANAPGATLYVYEIPELTNKGIIDGYDKALSDNNADALSSSFGGCELELAGSTRTFSALAEQGVAKGMTFSASTGDNGGSLCPLAPASSPNFTAVGGTSLIIGRGGVWAAETAWSGSGGGISTIFSVPAWQLGYKNVVDRGRNMPDVALDADPATGAAFYVQGSWNTQDNPIGGTSLSSPLFAAAVTEIDQMKNARTLLDSSQLFKVAASKGYGTPATPIFHDIVEGGNPFIASPGYDLVTGIGTPDFWNIAKWL